LILFGKGSARMDAGAVNRVKLGHGGWQGVLSSVHSLRGEICATGTRIPVTVILDSLAEGATKDEILAILSGLRVHHIDAALAYAAELAHEERLVPIRQCEVQD